MRMGMHTRRAATAYMRTRLEDYRDRRTAKVNLTGLVEDALDEFDLWDSAGVADPDVEAELEEIASDIEDGLL